MKVWYVGISHKFTQPYRHRMLTNGARDGCGIVVAKRFTIALSWDRTDRTHHFGLSYVPARWIRAGTYDKPK